MRTELYVKRVANKTNGIVKISLKNWKPALNVKPDIWYFAHTLAKLNSQKNLSFYDNFLCDNKWTQLCALSNIKCTRIFQLKWHNSLRDFRNIFFGRQFLRLR